MQSPSTNTKEQELQAALKRFDELLIKYPNADACKVVIAAVRELQAERDRLREEATCKERLHVARVAELEAQLNGTMHAGGYEYFANQVRNLEGQAHNARWLAEKAEAENAALVSELVKLFDWSDTSYIHALLHVGNAVSNLRCDLAVEKRENAALRGFIDAISQASGFPIVEDREQVTGTIIKRIKRVDMDREALRAHVEALANAEVLTRDDVMNDETGAWSLIPALVEGDVCYIVRALPTPNPDAKEDQP